MHYVARSLEKASLLQSMLKYPPSLLFTCALSRLFSLLFLRA